MNQTQNRISFIFSYKKGRKIFNNIATELSKVGKNEVKQYQYLFRCSDILNNTFKIKKTYSTKYAIINILEHDGIPVVMKMSCSQDSMVYNEEIVLKDLTNLRIYCPHFGYFYMAISIPISLQYLSKPLETSILRERNEPFIFHRVIYQEYIEGETLDKFIRHCKDRNVIFSIIYQVILAIKIAQIKVSFTHFDLHFKNVMIKRCNVNDVFLYHIDKKDYIIPTYGYYPVIIDLGLSYSKSIDNDYFYSLIINTHKGLINRFEKCADYHYFILNTFQELALNDNYYKSIEEEFNKRISHPNIIKGRKSLKKDIYKDIVEFFDIHFKKSKDEYYYNNIYNIIHSINIIIKLPFSKTDYGDINKHIVIFMDQYTKLSSKLEYDSYRNHLLRCICSLIQKKGTAVSISNISNYFPFSIPKMELSLLLNSILAISKWFNSLYYNLYMDDMPEKINKTVKCDFLDIYNILLKHHKLNWNGPCELHFWNIDNESYVREYGDLKKSIDKIKDYKNFRLD